MAGQDVPVRPYEPTAARAHLSGELPRPKTVTVDFHGHMRIPAADELVGPAEAIREFRFRSPSPGTPCGSSME